MKQEGCEQQGESGTEGLDTPRPGRRDRASPAKTEAVKACECKEASCDSTGEGRRAWRMISCCLSIVVAVGIALLPTVNKVAWEGERAEVTNQKQRADRRHGIPQY